MQLIHAKGAMLAQILDETFPSGTKGWHVSPRSWWSGRFAPACRGSSRRTFSIGSRIIS